MLGLAPYGEPRYASTILDHFVDIKPDGSFRLDQTYFDYCTGPQHDVAEIRRAIRRARACA